MEPPRLIKHQGHSYYHKTPHAISCHFLYFWRLCDSHYIFVTWQIFFSSLLQTFILLPVLFFLVGLNLDSSPSLLVLPHFDINTVPSQFLWLFSCYVCFSRLHFWYKLYSMSMRKRWRHFFPSYNLSNLCVGLADWDCIVFVEHKVWTKTQCNLFKKHNPYVSKYLYVSISKGWWLIFCFTFTLLCNCLFLLSPPVKSRGKWLIQPEPEGC